MVEDHLTLTLSSKIDLARLPLCFSDLIPHAYAELIIALFLINELINHL